MIRSRIIGTGHYLPENVVTNFDLEKSMDTNDEWIRQRTGILQRHMVKPGEGPSSLATEASRRAMEKAGVAPAEIDYVICATITADYLFPSAACLVQHNLGLQNAGAMDIGAACSGFIYGLEVADAFIRAGVHNTILVIGAEVLSSRLDFTKRDTAVLFGDGAGAVVVRGEDNGADRGILSTYVNADGGAAELLYIPGGGSRAPISPDNIEQDNRAIVMDGRGLYKRAVAAFTEATVKALEQTGFTADDIDIFIPHQANRRIIDSATQRLGLPDEKVYLNLDKVANTSAASIPIALDCAVADGKVTNGRLLLLAAFGAGLTWASAMVRW